jgi:hypothetical protein
MRWLVVVVALTSVAHADNGPEAEAGFGAGGWNAEHTSIEDVRFAVGGHFDVGNELVLHTGVAADLLLVDTTANNGLAELGAYGALSVPLQGGWSYGPRVSFEIVEKPIVMVGMGIRHRPVSFNVDAVHLFKDEKPTGVIASASLTGKAGAWGVAIGAVVGLIVASFSRGNG